MLALPPDSFLGSGSRAPPSCVSPGDESPATRAPPGTLPPRTLPGRLTGEREQVAERGGSGPEGAARVPEEGCLRVQPESQRRGGFGLSQPTRATMGREAFLRDGVPYSM